MRYNRDKRIILINENGLLHSGDRAYDTIVAEKINFKHKKKRKKITDASPHAIYSYTVSLT